MGNLLLWGYAFMHANPAHRAQLRCVVGKAGQALLDDRRWSAETCSIFTTVQSGKGGGECPPEWSNVGKLHEEAMCCSGGLMSPSHAAAMHVPLVQGGKGGMSILDESDKGKRGEEAAGGLGTGALLKEHADASKEQAKALRP